MKIKKIDLQRLSADSIEKLISDQFGGGEVPHSIISQVASRADGNPLFAEELIRVIGEDGLFGGGTGNETADFYVPDTLKDLLTARLDHIGVAKETAQLASVIGRRFDYDLLRSVSDKEEGELLADLDQLISSRIVHTPKTTGAVEYIFHHALTRDIAYESLMSDEKQKMHLKVADVLVGEYQVPLSTFEEVVKSGGKKLDFEEVLDGVIFQLAYHYESGGDDFNAVEFLIEAGNRASRLSSYMEAERYFDSVMENLELNKFGEWGKLKRLDAVIALSSIYKTTKGWINDDVKRIHKEAQELCAELGREGELAPILFGIWAVELMSLRFESSVDVAQRLYEIGEKINDSDILNQAYVCFSNSYFWLGRFEEACDSASKSLSLYDPEQCSQYLIKYGQDPRSLAYMFKVLSLSLLGDEEQALRLRDEMMAVAVGLDHTFTLAIALQASAWFDFQNMNLYGAAQTGQELIDLSIENNFPSYRGVALLHNGWAIGMLGDAEEGVKRIREGYEKWIKESAGSIAHSMYIMQLGEVLIKAGRAQEALKYIDEGLDQLFEKTYEVALLQLKAVALKDVDPSRSEKLFGKARGIAEKQGSEFLLKRVEALGLM